MEREQIEERFRQIAASRAFGNILPAYDLGRKAVLDVGCCHGEHLVHFGPGSRGLSVNPEEVAYGASRGLDIRLANVEQDELAEEQGAFDFVFASNVFEHLYSPHGFLVKIRRCLRPGGLLMVGVPVVPGLASLLRLRPFRGSLATAHVNFFTRHTLRLTVERAGWVVSRVRPFYFRSALLDALLGPVSPQFYAVATVDPGFRYHEKRLKELQGYLDPALMGRQAQGA